MAARTGEGYQTPIPNRDIESKSAGSGPVITYQLSPEELERYRAMPVRENRGRNGEKIRKPAAVTANLSPEEQRRRAKARYQKEEEGKDMLTQQKDGQTVEKFVPDKVEFLKQIATGKSINKVEKEMGMKPSTLFYYVKKWGWGGIKPDRAQQLLDEMAIDGLTAISKPVGDPSVTRVDLNSAKQQQENAAARIKDAEIAELRQHIAQLESTIAEQFEKQIETTGELLDSRAEDLARYKRVMEELEVNKVALGAAKLFIEDLEQDRALLLETIEKSAIVDESPAPKLVGRSLHTDLDAPTEQIVDELAALISYLRSGNGQAFHLDIQLNEVAI